MMTEPIFRKIEFLYRAVLLIGKSKIFCISIQRSGTTSVGKFLKDHGYHTSGYGEYSKKWSYEWSKGNVEKIFNSLEFRSYQAFEDSPWYYPDFYKVIHCRYPKAKFILFQRDPDKWFDSMLRHSKGKTLGNTHRHCKIYRRLNEFYREAIDYFKKYTPDKLFFAHLEDHDKWQKLAGFLNVDIDKDYDVHANKSIEY